ncbi:hypothetical protein OG417_47015 [Actinoallomurus sp. NBC_01490]|uniref:hypothetical protein n=1 Tax=Actinoallomurus sp. NBC_01490 TaxID=2903557 RepID=UPI002E308C84|nr:hypothetical protein [Actinoallomurus sp. NBC_01490]
MSTQYNPIAALLNPTTTTTTNAPTTTDTGTQGTVGYDVAAGKHATQAQLGIDSSPDALITIDGHKVAAGDNGLSIDVAPDGSAHVVHGPQDPTQSLTQANDGRSTPYTPVGYNSTGQGQDGGQYADGTQQYADGSQTNGTQPTGHGTPLTGQWNQTGMTQDGTQPAGYTTQPANGSGDGGLTSGQYYPAGSTQDPSQDTTPIEHLQGIGDHAAKVDLALHGPNSNLPDPVIHTKADGSQDIVIPKGPDNPHAITLHVHPNKDGSFDLTVPKSDTNPHEVKIHVQPDKHVDLNITQDKDGHIKIDAHDHPADQQDDWSGLQGPAGQNPGYGNGTPVPGQGDPQDGSGQQPGTDGLPQTPDIPTPQTPGAGSPSGGGGGIPSGGVPSSRTPSDGKPSKPDKPAQTVDTGSMDVDGQTIQKRGSDLAAGPVKTLNTALTHAQGINVGFPGFGIIGSPLQSVYSSMSESAATELQQGSLTLSANSQGMAATGKVYTDTAQITNQRVQDTPGAGS